MLSYPRIFGSLATSIAHHLSSRPPAADIKATSFQHVVYELAGILEAYIFPYLSLQHTRRPFRLAALLPLLLSYPGFLYKQLHTPSFDPSSLSSVVEADLQSPFPLVSAVLFLLHANVPVDDLCKYLEALLPAQAALSAAVAAEKTAHYAILDAVLAWKEQKKDRRLQHFKQD
ncbi:hypothetical protein JCM11641_000294 [Rhodosporidiobolus odoratus]